MMFVLRVVLSLFFRSCFVIDIRFFHVLESNSILFVRVKVMMSNATFNNISDISCLSVLLVEETGVPGENHRPAESN